MLSRHQNYAKTLLCVLCFMCFMFTCLFMHEISILAPNKKMQRGQNYTGTYSHMIGAFCGQSHPCFSTKEQRRGQALSRIFCFFFIFESFLKQLFKNEDLTSGLLLMIIQVSIMEFFLVTPQALHLISLKCPDAPWMQENAFATTEGPCLPLTFTDN